MIEMIAGEDIKCGDMITVDEKTGLAVRYKIPTNSDGTESEYVNVYKGTFHGALIDLNNALSDLWNAILKVKIWSWKRGKK